MLRPSMRVPPSPSRAVARRRASSTCGGAARSTCAISAGRRRRRRGARRTSPSTRRRAPSRSAACTHRLSGERRREPAGAAARAADGAVCVGSRDGAASAAAAAAAVGARARVPRALLHEEPPLLDDVRARCGGRGMSTSSSGCIGVGGVIRGVGRGGTARRSSTSGTRSPGTGYRTLGDAWLAESGAARARERRRARARGASERTVWPAGRRRERIEGGRRW